MSPVDHAPSPDPTVQPTPLPSRPARRPWFLAALGLLVALGTSYGAYQLANYSWNEVVDYESPYLGISISAFIGERPPLELPVPDATPRRVVMVVVDGLADAASRDMSTLNGLRGRGADVSLTVPQPSLSYPSWTTILTGAPPHVSGVTTNWHDRRVELQTLFDTVTGSGRSLAVVGPTDLDLLYGVSNLTSATALQDWPEEANAYLTGDFVDRAIGFLQERDPDFLFVLVPDVDEAGHAHGSASAEYAGVVAKVDADLARLIEAADDGETVFVVLPDHGQLPEGGHGGWEDAVIHTSATFAGPGVKQGTASANLDDIASTVSVLAGLQAPEMGAGLAIAEVLADPNGRSQDADLLRAAGFTIAYAREIAGQAAIEDVESLGSANDLDALAASAEERRHASEREERLPIALGGAVAALAVLVIIGLASWRVLVSALTGMAGYAALYNLLFFVVHGYRWSLSAFNEEDLVQAFMNGRMIEALIAGLAGCVIAALTYAALHRGRADGARPSAATSLSLGIATALAILGFLGLQVAWFVWQWGPTTTWILPDLKWGFKYDLDLLQATAIAGVALLGPVVTLLVGRLATRAQRA